MLSRSIGQWVSKLGQKPVTAVLHTSCVCYGETALQNLVQLPLQLLLPDNVYWELTLLCRSRIFGTRAEFLLQHCRREDWDLEQLYSSCRDRRRGESLFDGGTVLFLFGDLNKQREFLGHIPPMENWYFVCNRQWSLKYPGVVCSLKDPEKYVRDLIPVFPLEPGIPGGGLKTQYMVGLRGDRAFLWTSEFTDIRKSGNYADLYTCSSYPELYAKIYHSPLGPGNGVKKLELLQRLDQKLHFRHMAMPQQLLENAGAQVVGFFMKRCPGRPVRDFLQVGWEGYDLPVILGNLLLRLLELHCLHGLMNDLSANNVLVDRDNQVYLIDCDSFQYLGYPGGGITELYQHPEIDPAHCHDVLREPRHEYFAFAVLLFQCLFYCDPVCQVQGWEDDRELNWKNAVFALEAEPSPERKVSAEVDALWRAREARVRKLFSDAFHFRADVSFGAWIRELDVLDQRKER